MTAQKYMRIEAKERFFEKTLKEFKLVKVTSPSISYFKDYSILLTDNGVTIKGQKGQKDTLYLKLR